MILYIDCFAGLSGDMFLAAFADLGMDMKLIADRVNSLCLNVKVSINAEPITQHGLTGKIIFIDITGEEKHHRHYDDIKSKIENSAAIPEAEKKTALAIFDTIARAEAEVASSAKGNTLVLKTTAKTFRYLDEEELARRRAAAKAKGVKKK